MRAGLSDQWPHLPPEEPDEALEIGLVFCGLDRDRRGPEAREPPDHPRDRLRVTGDTRTRSRRTAPLRDLRVEALLCSRTRRRDLAGHDLVRRRAITTRAAQTRTRRLDQLARPPHAVLVELRHQRSV